MRAMYRFEQADGGAAATIKRVELMQQEAAAAVRRATELQAEIDRRLRDSRRRLERAEVDGAPQQR